MIDQPPASPSFAQALSEYESLHLASRNFALRTRREYLGDLKSLVRFLDQKCSISSPERVTRAQLDAYLAHLDSQGYSGAARRRQLSSIKSFFGFLLQQAVITLDPTAKLIPPERER